MTSRFQGKNVFVTGAGSGFGRATSLGFAREGAANVYLVDRLPDRLKSVAAEVEAFGANPVQIECDAGDLDQCDRAVETALAVSEKLDVLVSNIAMMAWYRPFLELEDAAWDEELRINLTSHYVFAQRAARAMAKSGGGVILFTASVNALGAGEGFAPYCITKAGLVTMAQVMAVELAQHSIRVNCVSPGPADTQRSVDLVGEEKMEEFRASFPGVPMNRLASADDIAEAFLYLASDQAGYVTGQNLIVDGGLTAKIYDVPD